jgi:hypothetical protein
MVHWPATIKTPKGSIGGKTKDISVDGVFIFCPEDPKVEKDFPVVFEPVGERLISVYGEKVWSSDFNIDDRTVFGMGIRFTVMSPEDRRFIATLIEKERDD